jgi:hypothetical protein
MTSEQAEFVKEFRVVLGYSWKEVHREWSEQYENNTILRGNQKKGIELCNEAMELLNEKIEDGWN